LPRAPATVFYIANVLLHLVLGAPLSSGWADWRRSPRVLPLVVAGALDVS
jgi:hypothetical protein